MAVRTWDYGAATTDWATAANWTGDTIPAADDEVTFDSTSVVAPTTGMTDGGSVNDSGHANNCTFDLLHFKKGYTVGIGTAALPCVCSPDKIIIDGTGEYHICVGKTNQSTNTTCANVIINNKDAVVYLYSNCNDGANVAEFTTVMVTGGTLYLEDYDADTDPTGCSVANLYLVPKNQSDSNVTVYIKKDAYDVLNNQSTTIYMFGGTLTTDSKIGDCFMYSGTLNYGTALATAEADLNITLLRMYSGIFNWYPDDDGNATITQAWIYGGSFLANASTNDHQAKTITILYSFSGSSVNLANSKGNITVSAWYDFGSTIGVDSHSKLALTYDQP